MQGRPSPGNIHNHTKAGGYRKVISNPDICSTERIPMLEETLGKEKTEGAAVCIRHFAISSITNKKKALGSSLGLGREWHR